MRAIAVHPVHENDQDSHQLSFTFRLRVLHVATGQPVTDALADEPLVDERVLERRATHPLQVLLGRRPVFSHKQTGTFSFGVHELVTFEDTSARGSDGTRRSNTRSSTNGSSASARK